MAHVGERRSAYRVLVGKPEGRRLHDTPLREWEVSITINLKEVGWGIDWIRVA